MKIEIESRRVTIAVADEKNPAGPTQLIEAWGYVFLFRGHEIAAGRIGGNHAGPDYVVLFLPGYGALEQPDDCPDLLFKIESFLRRSPERLDWMERHIRDVKAGKIYHLFFRSAQRQPAPAGQLT